MNVDLYVGFDESNNGKPFEIHTAVFSLSACDAGRSRVLMSKFRAHKNLFRRLKRREYSFLLFTDSDKQRLQKNERLGAIASSLLYEEFDWQEFEDFRLFFDGDKTKREISNTIEMIHAKIPEINPDRIQLSSGPQLDQRVFLVNLADEMAHYLYRKGINYVAEHADRKVLIY